MHTSHAAGAHEALVQFLYRAPIGLLQTTLDGEIVMINPMAAQCLMPFAPDGQLSNLFEALRQVAPDLRQRLAATEPVPGATVCENLRLAWPTGRRVLALDLQRLDDAHLMASVSDVTLVEQQEHQRLNLRLRDAARVDRLTTLPNRVAVLERLAGAMHARPPRPVAVLCINADRFSGVNVAHGAAVGDELLCHMAQRLTQALRPGDGLGLPSAARVGGDEFVVLLDGVGLPGPALGVAHRLGELLARPYGIGPLRLHVAVSIGLALSMSTSGLEPDDVLQEAGMAMRAAKRGGGARCVLYEPNMRLLAASRGSLEQDLRAAIERDELFVVYQPIVQLADGRCSGFEALVRWLHPQRGLVAPVEFIGVAEDCGLIAAIGARVLQQACAQFARWRQAWGDDAPAVLSVNLSRGQFDEPGLLEQVQRSLADSGLPASCLQLELTESMAGQADVLQSQLPALKALGLSLALDDFGTGYSSLACLHQLPMDVVKIDRSFVSQVETSDHHRVLIDATVRVARSLGMGTVAEGIETPGQARLLHTLGCDKGQGYLFARPMTTAQVQAWWDERLTVAQT